MFVLSVDPIALPDRPDHASGAAVVFEGRVRVENEGREVLALEYEAFGEMARTEGDRVLAEAVERFGVRSAECVHRTGRLELGELAVLVRVMAGHRREAFEACAWIMDQLKARVPIWKKEFYVEGDSGWIHPAPVKAGFRLDASRYTRQVRLPEVGREGQQRLAETRVLLVGAGGLGSAALPYLAAAGFGQIDIVDPDRLEASNLHRQTIYAEQDIGRRKARLAAELVARLNPGVRVRAFEERVDALNASGRLADCDIVLDGTDSLEAKFVLNDAAVRAGRPLVQASLHQFEGQILVVAPGGPCLRCLWPEEPTDGCVGTCEEAGVLGVLPGLFGILQVNEALKIVLGMPGVLRDHLLLADLRTYETVQIRRRHRVDCPICSGKERPAPEPLTVREVAWDRQIPHQFESWHVVDVRERDENPAPPAFCYLTWCNLPASQFDVRELPEGELLLVCSRGFRSRRLAAQIGARAWSLKGGVDSG